MQFQGRNNSAYYSKQQVTIHPAVVHFKKPKRTTRGWQFIGRGTINPQELRYIISDETAHTAETILAFMKTLIPQIKTLVNGLQTIHYLTDLPTSQYRNANMFNITFLHPVLFDVTATWQYFESGHRKGSCDGVGGAVKRSANLAVKRRLIQTANDFFRRGIEHMIKTSRRSSF